MHQDAYAVARRDEGWIISFGGRTFDRFGSKKEALSQALRWAREAPRRESIVIKVALEDEDGRTDIIDPHQE